ncbi:uncharacterized protein BDR25DRAFT_341269 [Lindgomyces ingoldianus]|uniref:Uncharacterized protein n=1 Tax=Lindgomyces ingoldianus TaxID=673940 RepID=A0ACB6R454_9PLEO|nr:uncharacterized protein BDR25DRAFT_341269 [Lindgomyces ingoldianus]KAF2473090.1 hypothetical protein BDR25DRAFT_341269 [Lindgomyces ingoldianus]
MRRIPRPQRPIENLLPYYPSWRPRLVCFTGFPARYRFSPTSATFSSSTRYNGIFDGKPDKKKHQAMVRRWQKRLLGESEPIGAHVDPYDPTSPVRITPEEQGEEQEMLEEAEDGEGLGEYEEAVTWDGLEVVGGEKWAKEFNEWQKGDKLRGWEGSAYAPQTKVTEQSQLNNAFLRAVVETYMLIQAKQEPTLASHPERFSSEDPTWIYNVKLHAAPDGQLELNFPPEAMKEFLEEVNYREAKEQAVEEGLEEVVEEYIAEEVHAEAENSSHEPGSQSIDNAIAGSTDAVPTKAAALVKQNEKKPFDFMSNRPVPRAKREESTMTVDEVTETTTVNPESPSPTAELEALASTSEEAVATMRTAVRNAIETLAAQSISIQNPTVSEGPELVDYYEIQLTDPQIKFALSKRLLQLTSLRITDHLLNNSSTLGDLYTHLLAAAKPKPKKLIDQIRAEGEIQDKVKPGMEDLLRLPNVKLKDKRVTKVDKEREVGRWKVIEYALRERDLPVFTKDDVVEDRLKMERRKSRLWARAV